MQIWLFKRDFHWILCQECTTAVLPPDANRGESATLPSVSSSEYRCPGWREIRNLIYLWHLITLIAVFKFGEQTILKAPLPSHDFWATVFKGSTNSVISVIYRKLYFWWSLIFNTTKKRLTGSRTRGLTEWSISSTFHMDVRSLSITSVRSDPLHIHFMYLRGKSNCFLSIFSIPF